MPTLKLYTSPRACSTACHIALEESGLDYEVEIIKIREGQHKTADYLAINPWGKIPTLLIGDEVLTEAHAILSYIGKKSPNSYCCFIPWIVNCPGPLGHKSSNFPKYFDFSN